MGGERSPVRLALLQGRAAPLGRQALGPFPVFDGLLPRAPQARAHDCEGEQEHPDDAQLLVRGFERSARLRRPAHAGAARGALAVGSTAGGLGRRRHKATDLSREEPTRICGPLAPLRTGAATRQLALSDTSCRCRGLFAASCNAPSHRAQEGAPSRHSSLSCASAGQFRPENVYRGLSDNLPKFCAEWRRSSPLRSDGPIACNDAARHRGAALVVGYTSTR